ncbi:MAG: response regulator transcription factor, partial [Desulfobacterales bacterium]|nr:response regulator transcription factor [Desulfobacterales bacterium]
MYSLLIIDDDIELCELLKEFLTSEGFKITTINHGADGLSVSISQDFHLIILDVMLPGMNGFDILRSLRLQSAVPVLMLTAKGEDIDRIVGLEMGADDYLPKPFNPRELLARIRALLRRSQNTKKEAVFTPQDHVKININDIELNMSARVVTYKGKILDLTALEFNLLEVLLKNAGHVVTRDMMSEKVLGRKPDPFDRS